MSQAAVGLTRAGEVFPVIGLEHIEFYVGNARQAAHFYRSALGPFPVSALVMACPHIALAKSEFDPVPAQVFSSAMRSWRCQHSQNAEFKRHLGFPSRRDSPYQGLPERCRGTAS